MNLNRQLFELYRVSYKFLQILDQEIVEFSNPFQMMTPVGDVTFQVRAQRMRSELA